MTDERGVVLQGSISSDATVSGITIQDNTVINNDQALRIKTKADATSASVTNVTYSGNKASGIRQFGVIIDQSYPDTLGTPGTGVKLSVRALFIYSLFNSMLNRTTQGVNFVGATNSLTVNSDAERVAGARHAGDPARHRHTDVLSLRETLTEIAACLPNQTR